MVHSPMSCQRFGITTQSSVNRKHTLAGSHFGRLCMGLPT